LTWKGDFLVRQTPRSKIDQIYVPLSLRRRLFDYIHEYLAHFGAKKTFHILSQTFFWPNYERDTTEWTGACDTCQRNSPYNTFRPVVGAFTPNSPNEVVEWDLTGPFRDPDGTLWYILVMIDLFTKWVEAIPIGNTSASTLVECLHSEWVTRYGPPKQLHNDQGSNFMSKEVNDYCNKLGINHTHTTAYHPQGNGGVERVNRTIKEHLSRVKTVNGSWRTALPDVLWAYRLSLHSSTKFAPYYLQFGRNPPLPPLFARQSSSTSQRDNSISLEGNIRRSQATASHNLHRARDRMLKRVNKGRHSVNLRSGQHVLLRRPGVQPSLSEKWDGPFEVVRTNPNNTIVIINDSQLPETVHLSRVKLYRGQNPGPSTTLVPDPTGETQSTWEATQPVETSQSRQGRRVVRPSYLDDYILNSPETNFLSISGAPLGNQTTRATHLSDLSKARGNFSTLTSRPTDPSAHYAQLDNSSQAATTLEQMGDEAGGN
jgi:hypothetical protein